MPIKFNDYFEFPRELDIEPYTVLFSCSVTSLIDENTSDHSNNTNNSTR
jgi:hypothetical protein